MASSLALRARALAADMDRVVEVAAEKDREVARRISNLRPQNTSRAGTTQAAQVLLVSRTADSIGSPKQHSKVATGNTVTATATALDSAADARRQRQQRQQAKMRFLRPPSRQDLLAAAAHSNNEATMAAYASPPHSPGSSQTVHITRIPICMEALLAPDAKHKQHPTVAAAKGEGEHEPDLSKGNQVDGTDSKGETSSSVDSAHTQIVERDVGGQTALGAGLRHMRVSELQKRAVATGAATSAIDAALDAQDTKAELIRLIVAHEAHIACKTPPQTVAPPAALPLQRASQSHFLVQLNLPQVQQRALELGVRKGLIDEALSQPSVRVDGVLCLCKSSFSETQCACKYI
jgi:hypothetical protein